MTGCSNRRLLQECEKHLTFNENASASILVMDIDNFKSINDKFGHECGDAVLRHFCDLVRSIIHPADYFIRLGGEEFAITMANKSPDQVEIQANELRNLVEHTPLLMNGELVSFTVSIGIAFKNMHEKVKIDDMLRIADEHLYIAKNNGRNQVVLAA